MITSDNPVIILNDKNYGINRPNTKIIFPISPYLTFYLDDLIDEPEWQYYPITDEQAIGLNYLQSISDIKLLLSPRPIDLVHAEIKENILSNKHGA